jgi:hypothetical protein
MHINEWNCSNIHTFYHYFNFEIWRTLYVYNSVCWYLINTHLPILVLLISWLLQYLRNPVSTDWSRINATSEKFSILTLCILIQVGSLPTGGSFIIMEFIQFGRSRGDQVTLSRNPFHTKKKVTLHFIFKCFIWILHFEKVGYCQSALGRKLAEMHKAAKSDKGYGFHVENTIGRYI